MTAHVVDRRPRCSSAIFRLLKKGTNERNQQSKQTTRLLSTYPVLVHLGLVDDAKVTESKDAHVGIGTGTGEVSSIARERNRVDPIWMADERAEFGARSGVPQVNGVVTGSNSEHAAIVGDVEGTEGTVSKGADEGEESTRGCMGSAHGAVVGDGEDGVGVGGKDGWGQDEGAHGIGVDLDLKGWGVIQV